jgi:hypothetical protein
MADRELVAAARILKTRLKNASSPEEEEDIRRDIERARRDSSYRSRLARQERDSLVDSWYPDIALAAGLFTPAAPIAGVGMAGLGAARIAKGLERRSLELPWKMETGLGVFDMLAPGPTKFYRSLPSKLGITDLRPFPKWEPGMSRTPPRARGAAMRTRSQTKEAKAAKRRQQNAKRRAKNQEAKKAKEANEQKHSSIQEQASAEQKKLEKRKRIEAAKLVQQDQEPASIGFRPEGRSPEPQARYRPGFGKLELRPRELGGGGVAIGGERVAGDIFRSLPNPEATLHPDPFVQRAGELRNQWQATGDVSKPSLENRRYTTPFDEANEKLVAEKMREWADLHPDFAGVNVGKHYKIQEQQEELKLLNTFGGYDDYPQEILKMVRSNDDWENKRLLAGKSFQVSRKEFATWSQARKDRYLKELGDVKGIDRIRQQIRAIEYRPTGLGFQDEANKRALKKFFPGLTDEDIQAHLPVLKKQLQGALDQQQKFPNMSPRDVYERLKKIRPAYTAIDPETGIEEVMHEATNFLGDFQRAVHRASSSPSLPDTLNRMLKNVMLRFLAKPKKPGDYGQLMDASDPNTKLAVATIFARLVPVPVLDLMRPPNLKGTETALEYGTPRGYAQDDVTEEMLRIGQDLFGSEYVPRERGYIVDPGNPDAGEWVETFSTAVKNAPIHHEINLKNAEIGGGGNWSTNEMRDAVHEWAVTGQNAASGKTSEASRIMKNIRDIARDHVEWVKTDGRRGKRRDIDTVLSEIAPDRSYSHPDNLNRADDLVGRHFPGSKNDLIEQWIDEANESWQVAGIQPSEIVKRVTDSHVTGVKLLTRFMHGAPNPLRTEGANIRVGEADVPFVAREELVPATRYFLLPYIEAIDQQVLRDIEEGHQRGVDKFMTYFWRFDPAGRGAHSQQQVRAYRQRRGGQRLQKEAVWDPTAGAKDIAGGPVRPLESKSFYAKHHAKVPVPKDPPFLTSEYVLGGRAVERGFVSATTNKAMVDELLVSARRIDEISGEHAGAERLIKYSLRQNAAAWGLPVDRAGGSRAVAEGEHVSADMVDEWWNRIPEERRDEILVEGILANRMEVVTEWLRDTFRLPAKEISKDFPEGQRWATPPAVPASRAIPYTTGRSQDPLRVTEDLARLTTEQEEAGMYNLFSSVTGAPHRLLLEELTKVYGLKSPKGKGPMAGRVERDTSQYLESMNKALMAMMAFVGSIVAAQKAMQEEGEIAATG